MTFATSRQALAATLRHAFDGLLDLPLLQPSEAPAPSTSGSSRALAAYAEEIRYCPTCLLHLSRRQLVFGRGSAHAPLAFVGDCPSEADDQAGVPFSDGAGELLEKMIVAMRQRPENTYLTTFFKGVPKRERLTDLDFIRHCEDHVLRQLLSVSAPVIVALGEIPARALTRSDAPLALLRGQEFTWEGRRVFCTHHPRDLLTAPAKKKEAWDDLQRVMRALGGKS